MGLKRGLLPFAIVLAVAVGAYLRARQQHARWWGRVEQLCACNAPALRRLEALGSVPVGGLDRALAAQRRSLTGGCDDLRAAMTRRSFTQRLTGAPLRVSPSLDHARAQRDVARELGLTCGDEHRVFWEALRARIARERSPDNASPHDEARVAEEFLRVHDGVCARRAALSAPPSAYVVTASDADRQGRTCGE